jgi:hypothetical protein
MCTTLSIAARESTRAATRRRCRSVLFTFHHRGEPVDGYSTEWMTCMYGPSLALNKRAFVARYGTERELLAEVDKLIGAMQ